MKALPMLQTLFRQKAWANVDLFAAFSAVDARVHADAHHAAIRLLNHIYTVDQIFKGHLSGVAHGYVATNTEETPSLESLATSVRASDAWFNDYVNDVSVQSLSETIAFTFTDGQSGAMTRAEMLHHVLLHGSYHRGAVGRMLAEMGGPKLPDSLTSFLHKSEPQRRLASV